MTKDDQGLPRDNGMTRDDWDDQNDWGLLRMHGMTRDDWGDQR